MQKNGLNLQSDTEGLYHTYLLKWYKIDFKLTHYVIILMFNIPLFVFISWSIEHSEKFSVMLLTLLERYMFSLLYLL